MMSESMSAVTLDDYISDLTKILFEQVRVCEKRKRIEAQLPATFGSGVMRSRSFGLGGLFRFSVEHKYTYRSIFELLPKIQQFRKAETCVHAFD